MLRAIAVALAAAHVAAVRLQEADLEVEADVQGEVEDDVQGENEESRRRKRRPGHAFETIPPTILPPSPPTPLPPSGQCIGCSTDGQLGNQVQEPSLVAVNTEKLALAEDPQAPEEAPEEAGPGDFAMSRDSSKIKWDFMHDGQGFSYPPTINGPWKWMKRMLFSGRRKFAGVFDETTKAFEGLKDEIALEHTCAKKGRRDETYYAASLCYWIPDIKDPQLSDSFGLAWETRGNRMEMCPGISSGSGGKCVKCSACHNNARAEGRKLSYTNFRTEIPLDTENGCMTETKIESNITTTFREDAANADLVQNNDDCLKARDEVAQAESLVAQNEEQQTTKMAEQGQLQNEKNSNIQRMNELANQIGDANIQIATQRGIAYSECQSCCFMTSWHPELQFNNIDTPTILQLMRTTFRQLQNDPFGDHFGHERQCIDVANRMGNLVDDVQWKEQERFQLENTNRQIDARIAKVQEDIDRLVAEKVVLLEAVETSRKNLADVDARMPVSCEATEEEYKTQLSNKMQSDVPKFYVHSCEKACMDFVSHEGCGVVEGNTIPQGGDVTNTGQARALCEPPSLSWVRAPFNYINVTDDLRKSLINQQCQTLFNTQQPIRAQAIKKSGWLLKRERLWRRWRERFFVLEGGDEGRSGVMRYWRDIAQDERYNQGIILWDAKGTKLKPGSRYGWRDGTSCFKLYHFYRDYRFCVPPKEGQNAEEEAKSWQELIQNEIRFPKQRNE